ncbi:hypothetical protein GBF38_003618 [Nibea albiflora]|uniref:Uncharacterized protein n=1 Tax=Nibea albiflora TaxID=240163 RepID=A0ACB7FK44_NIBAL|nr:hypothetical protein GBF38_003618 [Nibea albiflora]
MLMLPNRLAGCRFTAAHLRVLDLSRNDLQGCGLEKLSEFLAEPLCELETLTLSAAVSGLSSEVEPFIPQRAGADPGGPDPKLLSHLKNNHHTLQTLTK